jgi:hypothetical protein
MKTLKDTEVKMKAGKYSAFINPALYKGDADAVELRGN